jgi:hypothetical protein
MKFEHHRPIVVLVAMTVAAVSPSAAVAAVYGGSTSGDAPIAITLAKSGKVKKVAVDWMASCDSGSRYPFGGVLAAVAKRPAVISPGVNPLIGSIKNGRLKATALGSDTLGDGMSAAITQHVTGNFKPASASGRWSAHVEILDAEGNVVDRCKTGALRWSARRGPNVYGGTTTQGEPVVVQTSKDRSRIAYIGLGWRASCSPSGFVAFAEEFGNFPVTDDGAFGDQWTSDYPFTDGTGKNSFSYNVTGTLMKAGGSGSLSVDLVSSDSAGARTGSCHTNRVRWSVAH